MGQVVMATKSQEGHGVHRNPMMYRNRGMMFVFLACMSIWSEATMDYIVKNCKTSWMTYKFKQKNILHMKMTVS